MPKKVCFLVGLVLTIFVFPLQAQRAKDVQIVPGVATHMGQVASDHVVLHSVFTFATPPGGGLSTLPSLSLNDSSQMVRVILSMTVPSWLRLTKSWW